MMKIASLIAAAGMASAWDLPLLSNNTWMGNDDQPAGGIFVFDNSVGAWNNNTGSCTVSTSGDVSFLNGIDLWTTPYAGGNQYSFVDLRDADRAELSFLVNTELNGDALAEDFMSVSCDNGDNGSGPFFRSFPNHPQETNVRGSLSKAGDSWSSFAMVFPNPTFNLTFDDPSVVIGEEVNGAVAVDASVANSDDLWFSVNFGDNSIGGSWELEVMESA